MQKWESLAANIAAQCSISGSSQRGYVSFVLHSSEVEKPAYLLGSQAFISWLKLVKLV